MALTWRHNAQIAVTVVDVIMRLLFELLPFDNASRRWWHVFFFFSLAKHLTEHRSGSVPQQLRPPGRFALARQLVTEVKWGWENRGNFSRFASPGGRHTGEVTTVLLMKELQLLHQHIILVFLYYLEQLWGEWKVKALMWKRWKVDSVAGFGLISTTAAKVLFIDPSSFLLGFCVNVAFYCAWFHYKSTWPKNVFLEILFCDLCAFLFLLW